jgi:hypothetical protein
MADLNDFYKVDGVDDVMAEDMNRLISSSDYATFRNVETLTDNKALTDDDCPIQYLTPSGANRDVTLPDEATSNHKFIIMNPTGTSYSLVVKNYAGSTLSTLAAGGIAVFYSTGTEYATTSSAPEVTLTNTVTLTNKRITPRITTITSAAAPTVNTDNCDCVTITAQAEAITSMTTNLSGTPTNFQKLIYRIKDNGTARAITWGASFAARGVALPTTTVISKVLYVGFLYNTVTSTWDCVASAQEA